MEHARQVEILRELITRMDDGTTCDAGRVAVNRADVYTCEKLARQEWDTFFANHPQMIGLSGELPKPGSYLTVNDFRIPVLATRDQQGRFRAFVNACRHRGAELVSGARGEQARFTCAFHGWTYRNDGTLMGIRSGEQFGAVDKACLNLIELPSLEIHGLLFVHPREDGVINVDEILGDFGPELAAWDLAKAEYAGESVLDMPVNWKIANDTFGEVYHFNTLHRNTLAHLLHGDVATYREFGRNHRICVPSKFIDTLRHQPESQWTIRDGAVVAYYLFPNIQIVLLNSMLALAKIYPDAQRVGQSLTRVSHYGLPHIASQLANSDAAQKLSGENVYAADMAKPVEFSLEASAELFLSTVEHEDYAMGVKTQAAANSGLIKEFVFGRNEPALHHFHNNYREMLGQGPLPEYRAHRATP
ncbi:MAG: anthranilate 1,2-dioxygenase large subunit [Pseudomonadota bacterium]|jgi:phenylpropionate dioxygenase-like ring-hydroxylating dioxygenase large terminal subunit